MSDDDLRFGDIENSGNGGSLDPIQLLINLIVALILIYLALAMIEILFFDIPFFSV